MPKRTDPHPSSLRTPTEEGKVPKTRLKSSSQAFEICRELADQDKGRSKKRTRIFKAYNRFPPTDYSVLFARDQDWMSNVNFGMLAYMVDNNLSSFFDMVTERTLAADIRTKFGKTPKERGDYSDYISIGFDRMLREWDGFLLNVEQDLLDMLLYSKGIEMWDDDEGFQSEHVSADDFLVPDGTKVSFNNFDVCAIKKRYGLHELWEKVEDKESSDSRGWNRKAVLSAMRVLRKSWKERYKGDDGVEAFARDIASGTITVTAHLKEHVDCYILFIKEYDGKISRYVVLQDYQNVISLTRDQVIAGKEKAENAAIDEEGFLYSKTNYADSIDEIFAVFMDCAGGGMWHLVPSLAEKIFVQCRQYDFTMNAIMDAIKINMSLMLQASNSEASDKIKELVFGPYTIIPADVPFVQQRMQLDTQGATSALQFMMLDMFRGIGEYRVHEKTTSGQNPTATQSQLDAAEAAKLSGTQLKRYNNQHSLYYRKLFKKFIKLKHGEKGYEALQKFKDYMNECGVPAEAYKWDNIDTINSNMLAGAGSPSYKLMAAEKTIQITNISPMSEGQANAMEDALAALHGRSNTGRYMNRVKPDKTFNERMAGYENSLMANPFLNPRDVQVNPDDNDTHHLDVHFFDMEQTIALVNEKLKDGSLTEFLAQTAAIKLLNQSGHCLAHIEKMKRDEGKQEFVKVAVQKLNRLQRMADKLSKDLQSFKESQNQPNSLDPNDPDIMKKLALAQIDIDAAQQLSSIKAAAIAQGHQQRMEIDKEKAANAIAIERAKKLDGINTEKKKARTKKPASNE